jgi:hypothetical protein
MTTRHFPMAEYNEAQLIELVRRCARKDRVTTGWWEQLWRRDGTENGGRAVIITRPAKLEDYKETEFQRRADIIKRLMCFAIGSEAGKEITP